MRYTIPAAQVAAPHTATVEIQKSRFIGWCAHTPDTDTARALVAGVGGQQRAVSSSLFPRGQGRAVWGAPEQEQA